MNQNDLELVKQQFGIDQRRRDEEAEWLKALLEEVEEQLEQLEEGLVQRSRYYAEREEQKRRSGEAPDASGQDFAREYWNVVDRKFKIERRLHDLVREERDDLDHIARLEGRERSRERAMRGENAELPERAGRPVRTRTTGTARKNRQHKRRSSKVTTDARNN